MARKTHIELTQDYVKSILDYNSETGDFFWKVRTDVPKEWNTKWANKRTGHFGSPYRTLRINDKSYKSHRIAWLYVYGKLPIEIDHINFDTLDNRINNLREVTKCQNQRNKRLQRNNTSGYKGVCWNKNNGTWQAGIKINGKNKALGQFDNIELAHLAYCEAAALYHGEFARVA